MSDQPILPTDRRALLAGLGGLAAGTFLTAGRAEAGSLNPPAAPASTPGPEPRIAINAVNTPGDATSLFRITQPGSYYLTGNVTAQTGRSGIVIAASNVTIDLMGFWLIDSATPASSGTAIASLGLVQNISICNGMIRGWGGVGIDLSGTSFLVHSIQSDGNQGDGIRLGNAATVVLCSANANSGNGIRGGENCRITNCQAISNGLNGIEGGVGSNLSGCNTSSNGALASGGSNASIMVGASSTVIDCVAISTVSALIGGVGNHGVGIQASFRSQILSCSSHSNRGHGFRLADNSVIRDCNASGNGSGSTVSAGIYAGGSFNRIEGNTVNSSDRGIQVLAARNVIINNTAAANTINYEFAAGNSFGPIIDLTANATTPTPAVLGNAAATVMGSTDAWANFAY
jgi:parallel beta-helix repeat protein